MAVDAGNGADCKRGLGVGDRDLHDQTASAAVILVVVKKRKRFHVNLLLPCRLVGCVCLDFTGSISFGIKPPTAISLPPIDHFRLDADGALNPLVVAQRYGFLVPAEFVAAGNGNRIFTLSRTSQFYAQHHIGHAILDAAHRALQGTSFTRPSLFGLATGMSGLSATASTSSCFPSTTSLPPCTRVIPVPILSDNFAYLIVDPQSGKAACVDPAEPEKVLAAAKREGIQLSALLCTHKHWDHSGGNEEMARLIPGLDVVTTEFEDIPAATVRLGDDDVYTLGSLSIRALHTPCHTKGHVLFLVTPQDETEIREAKTAPVLFSGDTLFVGGCGRFFEGDGQQMVEALMGRVAKLPPQTLVYCGHEYTQANLAFALSVEPDNAALQAKAAWASSILQQGGFTVPSTVGSELDTNPFMRVAQEGVIKAARERGGAKGGNPAEVMTALREMKNNFKG